MSRFMPLVILSISVTLAGVLWLSGPFDSQSPEPSSENEAEAATSQEPPKSNATSELVPPAAQETTTDKNTAYPIAVTDKTSYDFGVLPRFTQSHHVFEIRNEGTAPLELEQGPSSCSCTILGLGTSKVMPGETAEIKLEWTLKFKEGEFSQSAVIYTNDPKRREIEFVVKGFTETRLGLSERNVVFSSLYPGDTPTKEVLLYSRTLKSLGEITQTVKAEIPGLKVTMHEASEDDLKSVEGRCGYVVKVDVPGDLESGHHVGQIQFTAHPDELSDEEEEEARSSTVALNVDLRVKRPGATFYSPLIDGWGRIKLGEVSSEEGSELLKLNFRVDQGDTPWKVKRIGKFPKYLDVKVVTKDQQRGLFQLQIQVPPGSPKGNFYGQTIGHIVLESDHPHIPRVPSERRIGIALEFHVK